MDRQDMNQCCNRITKNRLGRSATGRRNVGNNTCFFRKVVLLTIIQKLTQLRHPTRREQGLFKNKEILFFLQNWLPLLYCTSVSVKLFQLHCCVYKVFAVPLMLLLFQQCFTFITVSTKLLVLLGNFNCFIDVPTTHGI